MSCQSLSSSNQCRQQLKGLKDVVVAAAAAVPGTQTRDVVSPWVVDAVDVVTVVVTTDVVIVEDTDVSKGTDVVARPVPALIRVVNSGAVVVVPLWSRYRSCSRFPDMTETGGVPGWVNPAEGPWLTRGGCDSRACSWLVVTVAVGVETAETGTPLEQSTAVKIIQHQFALKRYPRGPASDLKWI